mmetsp:Transcript_28555/g.75001  ORF Transcript_28555/g.75001 Transcript_28555/m.75001 type:complete len:276 (+) Transcript_28555:1150-1977(+)
MSAIRRTAVTGPDFLVPGETMYSSYSGAAWPSHNLSGHANGKAKEWSILRATPASRSSAQPGMSTQKSSGSSAVHRSAFSVGLPLSSTSLANPLGPTFARHGTLTTAPLADTRPCPDAAWSRAARSATNRASSAVTQAFGLLVATSKASRRRRLRTVSPRERRRRPGAGDGVGEPVSREVAVVESKVSCAVASLPPCCTFNPTSTPVPAVETPTNVGAAGRGAGVGSAVPSVGAAVGAVGGGGGSTHCAHSLHDSFARKDPRLPLGPPSLSMSLQ